MTLSAVNCAPASALRAPPRSATHRTLGRQRRSARMTRPGAAVQQLYLAVTLLAAATFARPTTRRVVGGETADEGTYPWVVALDTVDGESEDVVYSCGGTLIAPSYVLTAAHCFWPKNGKPVESHWGNAYMGAHKSCFDTDDNLKTMDNKGCDAAEIRKITALYVHADYNDLVTSSDIAIAKLDKPVTTITPMAYRTAVFSDDQTFENEGKAFVLGWGVVDAKQKTMATHLQVGEVALLNKLRCGWTKGYQGQISSSMLCATSDQKIDSCAGDSGGPLYAPHSDEIIGITSWGFKCGSAKHPGVYTEVAEFSGWIANILAGNKPSTADTCDTYECPFGLSQNADAANIECTGNQCTSYQCCRATCSAYTCFGNFEQVANADNLECKNGRCSKNQCCTARVKTCDSHTCSGSSKSVPGASNVGCKNGWCTSKQCCREEPKTCDSYTCFGNSEKVLNPASVLCKKSGCKSNTCCRKVVELRAPKTCDSYKCSGKGWGPVENAQTTQCNKKPNGKFVCSKRHCCQKEPRNKNRNKN